MFGTTKSSLLVITALLAGANAESFTGRATYNPIWTSNACDGKPKDDKKLITALNSEQYGGGVNANLSPVCGQTLTVTYEGKSVEVTVVDKLPSHPAGDLDLSTAAFASIADTGLGNISVTWSWNNYDPANPSAQNVAALNAANVGAIGGTAAGSGSATGNTATSPVVPSVNTSAPVAPSATSQESSVASDTALPAADSGTPAAGSGTGAAAVESPAPSANDNAVEPSAPAIATDTGTTTGTLAAARPTGHGHDWRGGQSKRCNAQL